MSRIGRSLAIILVLIAVILPACSKGGGLQGGVPNVVGMDYPAARDALNAAGYANVTVHYVRGSADIGLERDYNVVTQSPAAGADVPKDSSIDLGLSFVGALPT